MNRPKAPPEYTKILEHLPPDQVIKWMASGIGDLPEGQYVHWDKLRHLDPPKGVTNEEWWAAIKLKRLSSRRWLKFKDKRGNPFSITEESRLYASLCKIDRDASGSIKVPHSDMINSNSRERYIVKSLIEEAITSSQLEGAVTSRREGKELLRSGRSPRNNSERMIVNNYLGMEFLRERADEDLTVSMLVELQKILTNGTMDQEAVGRLRRDDDQVVVVDGYDNEIVHTPPQASQLEKRMELIIDFANENKEDDGFIHPVIKAILLHFMIGYDHPFVDGNGRTARALFYWSMAKSEYWLTEFLSISAIIRNSPAKYARAYIFSESDDNDVTYFIDYNLEVIIKSIGELHSYLIRKAKETAQLQDMIRGSMAALKINHRQMDLLVHMLKHNDTLYTIDGHRRSHNVIYETARSDLNLLHKMEFIEKFKIGRNVVYRRNPQLENLLNQAFRASP